MSLRALILEAAEELGIPAVGIAPARVPEVEGERLRRWLERGFHGTMGWLDKPGIDRGDLETVLPGARAALMIAVDYPPALAPPEPGFGYVSTYARGPDYHALLKDRLRALAALIQRRAPGLAARPFVDTAPVLERAFARAAGLGWYGKNACLLRPGRGSYVFLGGLALSAEVEPDAPTTAHCGSCTRCLEVCPTGALVAPFELDARRCISYLTIEHRGPWEEELRGLVGDHVFGCDLCQAVCPWNQRFSQPGDETAFHAPDSALAPRPLTELFEAALASFKGLTRGTAATRSGKAGMLRNIVTAMGNHADRGARPQLERALDLEGAGIAEHARWALERLD